MANPKRILHIIAGMGSGGAEMMIMNWYRNIDTSKVQFDFLLRSDENIYEDEIKALGGRIFTVPEFPRHLIKNHTETERFFKEHASEFAAVHVHANALIYVDALILAKKYGIKRRIMHSHNTKTEMPLYLPIHYFNKMRIKKIANEYLACADDAGKWMFNEGYAIINNAIDLSRFDFNPDIRNAIRVSEDFGDRFIVGHVGRFLQSKNHPFLIKVFSEIKKQRKDALLVLIGTGVLENEIRRLVRDSGLEDSVRFLGVKKNVNEYLMAFDVMVFPSLFEGLGIAAVEAQAAALKIVSSTAVPESARVTDYITAYTLEESPAIWAQEAIKAAEGYERKTDYKALADAGFDIKIEALKMQEFYSK